MCITTVCIKRGKFSLNSIGNTIDKNAAIGRIFFNFYSALLGSADNGFFLWPMTKASPDAIAIIPAPINTVFTPCRTSG